MTPVAAKGIKFVGHSDMDGRGDGVQVMVHRGFAYVGHGYSNGITTLDVRDPKKPKVVDFIACAQGTRALHLQTHEDLLLAVNAPSVWTLQVLSEKDYFGGSPAELAAFSASRRVASAALAAFSARMRRSSASRAAFSARSRKLRAFSSSPRASLAWLRYVRAAF